MKAIAPILIILIMCSCSKSSSDNLTPTDNNSIYSNWTISNSLLTFDNDSYSSHWTSPAVSSHSTWYDTHNYFICNGYVYDSSGHNIKTTYALIKFSSKPTSNAVYHISTSSTNLGTNECNVLFNAETGRYNAISNNETVDVTVNNGLVTISFNNLSLSGYHQTQGGTYTANASGKLIEGS